MREGVILSWVVAVISAIIALMFGIVGVHGDDVALFIHFLMVGVSALFVIIGFVCAFIECYRGY